MSHEEKICVPLELTCPLEENIEKRHKQKYDKYVEEITSDNYRIERGGILEVGARGFILETLRRFMKQLGMSKKEAGRVVEECQKMVTRCSFVIWCQRFNPEFVATKMTL